jgi:hypothetical protein
MTTAAVAGPVRPGLPWWAAAGALLGGAFGAVLVYHVAAGSLGHWYTSPPPLSLQGGDFTVVSGKAHKEDDSLVLDELDADGTAVLAASPAAFTADDYRWVEWKMTSAAFPPRELLLVWRTREHPGRSFSKRIQWLISGAAPLDMHEDENWRGTVTGVALLVRGKLDSPLRLEALRLPAPSPAAIGRSTLREWSAYIPLQGSSIAFPLDPERGYALPPLPAVAIAVGMALLAYVLLARWRRLRRDPRVLWAIFLGGWLLLDLRWQVNLWHGAVATASQLAGKTGDEKHRLAADAVLFSMVQEVKGRLPPAPARIEIACDNVVICMRAGFLLLPYNVSVMMARHGAPNPGPEVLRSGDYLYVVFNTRIGYDPGGHQLVWSDGRTRAATLLLAQQGGLLLQIR